jgi:hypothetical protein
VQGRVYISAQHVCFHANILGWVTAVVIKASEIISVTKENTALVIPNAILIKTSNAK